MLQASFFFLFFFNSWQCELIFCHFQRMICYFLYLFSFFLHVFPSLFHCVGMQGLCHKYVAHACAPQRLEVRTGT